uniref:TonB-dependent receptor plug domain-containing protein n=1 Tax=Psychrobacter sp. TaxID=56811 RepID=UPI002FDA61EF
MSMSSLRSHLLYTRSSTRLPQWQQRALVTSIALALSAVAPFSAQAVPLYADISADMNTEAHGDMTNYAAMPNTRLDPIVVTATRSERALSDAPVAMQVLSRRQLDDNHAHTLKEALALLPNVYLREVHGKTGYEVSMQGFTGDQVLVLIDGLPITASTGSTVNLNQYMNMDIEQIEVVQGAASAQFGSAAMG